MINTNLWSQVRARRTAESTLLRCSAGGSSAILFPLRHHRLSVLRPESYSNQLTPEFAKPLELLSRKFVIVIFMVWSQNASQTRTQTDAITGTSWRGDCIRRATFDWAPLLIPPWLLARLLCESLVVSLASLARCQSHKEIPLTSCP